jgi:hypothetical protein
MMGVDQLIIKVLIAKKKFQMNNIFIVRDLLATLR